MGEHKLPKRALVLTPEHGEHIRESRLYSAQAFYGAGSPVDGIAKMWAARYRDDVSTLLAELDRLRALVATHPPSPQSDPKGVE